jgi:hypothetical protein
MKISYNTLNNQNKQFKLTDGIYVLEHDRSHKWAWTSTEFFGITQNVNKIIFGLNSNIKNKLFFEDLSVDINENCLNLVEIDVTNKTEFQFRLEKQYDTPSDQRILGVKIVSINIDGTFIF